MCTKLTFDEYALTTFSCTSEVAPIENFSLTFCMGAKGSEKNFNKERFFNPPIQEPCNSYKLPVALISLIEAEDALFNQDTRYLLVFPYERH